MIAIRWAIGLFCVVLSGVFVVGIGDVGDVSEADKALADRLIDVLQKGDDTALSSIVMGVEGLRVVALRENVDVDSERAKSNLEDRAKVTLHKAKRGLARVKKEGEKTGVEWTSAKVRGVRAMAGERDATESDLRVDVFVDITSAKGDIVVKLDDCFRVDGTTRVADGMFPSAMPAK